MAINILPAISRYESSNKNVVNYKFNSNPKMYSASGYYQITNTTWRGIAPSAGINLSQYPTAMSAPRSVQQTAATALVNKYGLQPWIGINPKTGQPFNPKLATYVANNGGPSNFVAIPGNTTSTGSSPNPGTVYGSGSSGVTNPNGTANGVVLTNGDYGGGGLSPSGASSGPGTGNYNGTTGSTGTVSSTYNFPSANPGGQYGGGSATGGQSTPNPLGTSAVTGNTTGSASTFWSWFEGIAGDFAMRGAVVVLGIVLIGVAVYALARKDITL